MRTIDADALYEEMYQTPYDNILDGTIGKEKILKAITDAPTVGGWISVEDRLPENAQFVLICLGRSIPLIGRYLNEDGWWIRNSGFLKNWGDTVTHWMPLPEVPPKEVR